MILPRLTFSEAIVLLEAAVFSALALRIIYRLYFHPLAKYPGPWYAASTSLTVALISVFKVEPQWLYSLVKKYGTEMPIRISPSLLLCPKPSALPEIYWDPKCNQKTGLYGTGAMGPPNLFTTLDGEVHKSLRKALGAPNLWSIGSLKKNWEPRIDERVQEFIDKMNQRSKSKDIVVLSDKVAEFAADVMTMFSFTNPWGFIKNQRDEHGLLGAWRHGLNFFGFAGRCEFFRDHLMRIPKLNVWLLPQTTDSRGMGYLMCEADREVTAREAAMKNGSKHLEAPDFLQHCLDAREDGHELSPAQKRAHVTLLIQAGADTTGTALGSTLRFIATHPEKKEKAFQEIQAADRDGKLSTPVQYEEAREHLPYLSSCIKESLRLNPPATNLFGRVAGKEGKRVDGHFLPPGTEFTSNAYVVQRDPELYAPDPDSFRPERWLESKDRALEYDAASFVFGMGPRICLGKDIALMEMWKLLPETIRRFDLQLVREGQYVVAGGVAYNQNFEVKLIPRT